MASRFLIVLACAALASSVCARTSLKLTREHAVYTHHGQDMEKVVERNDLTIKLTRRP